MARISTGNSEMKTGDLVRLRDRRSEHPAYKNRTLFLVKKAYIGKNLLGLPMAELYTPDGKLIAFNADDLEIVSESQEQEKENRET